MHIQRRNTEDSAGREWSLYNIGHVERRMDREELPIAVRPREPEYMDNADSSSLTSQPMS
jgi:hypothetical protein